MIIDGLPLKLHKNKSKMQSLNFNRFIKDNFYVRKRLEKEFFKIFKNICAELDCIYPEPPLQLTYTVFRQDHSKVDLSNICTVADKFSQDAMVKCGLIHDDNIKYIKDVRYQDGGVDKTHPRICLKISSLNHL